MAVVCSAVAVSCGSQKRCQDNSTGEMATMEEEIGTPVKVADADDSLVGDWAPIKMSSDSIVFGRDGGLVSVKCKNYPTWWLNDIQLEGKDKFWHADPGENNEYLTATAPGITATIINGNRVEIKVAPSNKASVWLVHLESGDAFATYKVIKNK